MRYLVIHKSSPANEAGIPPSKELIASMGALIPEGMKAGRILAGEGLRPSSTGVRLKFSGGKRTVTKGPLTGENELIAGYCIMRVKSLEEAIEWTTRFAEIVGDSELDIRPVMEPWDLGLCAKPAGDLTTRFMAVHKADPSYEAGAKTSPETMARMGRLIEEMWQAGVFLAAEGLAPGSQSVRVQFSGNRRTVIDGPFTESKELIAGFVMVQLPSMEEVIAWASRYGKIIMDGERRDDFEMDIRPVCEAAGAASPR